MNLDKENVRYRVKSKIPLPVDPLPALPRHVLKVLETKVERHPLKTINNQTLISNLTGATQKSDKNFIQSSDKKEKDKSKSKLKIDTKHVTVRQNTDDLDWDFKVLKDDTTKESSVIIISDDENHIECKSHEIRYFVDNDDKNCLGDAKKAVTPFKSPSLEPNRIRNIKKSLKRPHSRELQGLSSVAKLERAEGKHKRRLVFGGLQDKLQSPDPIQKSLMTCLNRDYSADVYMYLLNAEKQTAVPGISSITRACLINWLIKVNGLNGNPAVVQTALWYLDSILAIVHVQVEKLQLIAAACYWLAQKIHGQVVTAKRLVNCSCQAFSTGHLLAAEKAVINKLKFPTQPVLPQEYITYLSWCCDNSHPGEIEMAATFLCLAGVMVDKLLCQEWPSVLAAAAVRNAILLLGREECFLKLQENPVFKSIEKKISNECNVCKIQRKAVRYLSSPLYEYKALLECFEVPPYYIAQKIISAVNNLAVSQRKNQNCH